MSYHAHIDNAHSYASRDRAIKKAQKDIPAEVTWIIATNSDGRFVPVAVFNGSNVWKAGALAAKSIYCMGGG